MITELDYKNIMETAREDGFAEGKQEGLEVGRAEGRAVGLTEGRAEGRAEGRLEGITTVAKAMLASGMDISQISSLTGLSQEQIRNL